MFTRGLNKEKKGFRGGSAGFQSLPRSPPLAFPARGQVAPGPVGSVRCPAGGEAKSIYYISWLRQFSQSRPQNNPITDWIGGPEDACLTDDSLALEQPLPSSSSGYLSAAGRSLPPLSRPGPSHSRSEAETATLSPSLIPAPQPTLSLISKDSTQGLSIESLTLVPPVAADRILAVGTAQSLAVESEAFTHPQHQS